MLSKGNWGSVGGHGDRGKVVVNGLARKILYGNHGAEKTIEFNFRIRTLADMDPEERASIGEQYGCRRLRRFEFGL